MSETEIPIEPRMYICTRCKKAFVGYDTEKAWKDAFEYHLSKNCKENKDDKE